MTAPTSLQERLDSVVARLDRQGLPVTVRLDEQSRVCVTPLCVCSTRDEARMLAAVLAVASLVCWVKAA